MPLAALGGFLLIIGAIFAFYCAIGNYGSERNAYYFCDARQSPTGAFEYEAGHAGYAWRSFPVAGVECRWNALDGDVFATFHADFGLTVVGWATFALTISGIGFLSVNTFQGAIAESRRVGGRRTR